ncbi:MAG TPA: response regulator [bacterium]|nr:response regulator [bacterium]
MTGAAILFVTSEPMIPRLTGELLDRDGIVVCRAETVAEAERILAERDDIAAVCSEVVLSGETGIEFYDRLRGELGKGEMPFFFITALNVTSELGRRLRRDIRCHHLQKPIDPYELVTLLREAVHHD